MNATVKKGKEAPLVEREHFLSESPPSSWVNSGIHCCSRWNIHQIVFYASDIDRSIPFCVSYSSYFLHLYANLSGTTIPSAPNKGSIIKPISKKSPIKLGASEVGFEWQSIWSYMQL